MIKALGIKLRDIKPKVRKLEGNITSKKERGKKKSETYFSLV